MDDQLLEEIRRYSRLPRQHASFNNWHEKKVKESGIVDYFLEDNNHRGAHEFVLFEVPENDPSDAWLYDRNRNKTALEITELVNQGAIDAQIHNKPDYWEECERWVEHSYFEEQLNVRVQVKDKKCSVLFQQGINVQLLMHTDEMWVEACYEKHLEKGIDIKQHRFTTIWLMLSYSPHSQSCPIIELSHSI